MPYTLGVEREFIAQHYLVGGDWGAENQLHSHAYRLELQLEADHLDAFGYCVDIVQVEAALCGTPSVASALPGVRMPSRMTGMGLTVPPRDARALGEALIEVIANRPKYVRPRAPIAEMFSPDTTALHYEALFERLRGRRQAPPRQAPPRQVQP